MHDNKVVDAVVIGAGFYGSSIALYLKKTRNFKKVMIIEREDELLLRASYNNQARIHNGYHYPRSFTTAFRSRINLPRFITDYPFAVKKDFTKLYAIARRNSKVTSKQFERFCNEIGAQVDAAPRELKTLFEPRLIESVFLVQEYAFNASELAKWAMEQLQLQGVEIRLNTCVNSIINNDDSVSVNFDTLESVKAKYVFNCTYSGLNQIGGDFTSTNTLLKHEITEMALIQVPQPLQNIGITVMDGPFFSVMPFPSRQLHTLSHVRYTPHFQWNDASNINPYEKLASYPKISRVDRMVRDVSRYIPLINESLHKDSLFEVKTILVKNEGDDGRPILFEKHIEIPRLFSILGGKIDNIYDVLERLDAEEFI